MTIEGAGAAEDKNGNLLGLRDNGRDRIRYGHDKNEEFLDTASGESKTDLHGNGTDGQATRGRYHGGLTGNARRALKRKQRREAEATDG